jgi:hypothetical protein
MTQYEFQITKQGWGHHYVLCTARDIETAHRAVMNAYSPEFTVSLRPTERYAAHRFVCEIDASAA